MTPRGTLALTLALVAGGCGGTAVVRATGSTRVRAVSADQIQGAYVPAGTEFVVRMNEQVSTQGSRVGQPFSATLQTPLREPGGAVLVPPGATVSGHVAGLQWGRLPVIWLAFESIESPGGSLPLEVAVRGAERITLRGPARVALLPSHDNVGTAIFEPTFGAPYQNTLGEPNGGYGRPPFFGHPLEAVLPPQAWIRLVLTRPLLARGSTVFL
jgi:hypothetical protein